MRNNKKTVANGLRGQASSSSSSEYSQQQRRRLNQTAAGSAATALGKEMKVQQQMQQGTLDTGQVANTAAADVTNSGYRFPPPLPHHPGLPPL